MNKQEMFTLKNRQHSDERVHIPKGKSRKVLHERLHNLVKFWKPKGKPEHRA